MAHGYQANVLVAAIVRGDVHCVLLDLQVARTVDYLVTGLKKRGGGRDWFD